MKLVFLILLIISTQVYSQQNSNENHRIILRSQFGFFANYQIPEAQENKKIAEIDNILNIASRSNSFNYANTKDATGFVPQFGIEYRFLEKFRIMFDRRTFSSANKSLYVKAKDQSSLISPPFSLILNGRYDWTEVVQKYGFAYYQPIFNFLYIGGIARRYDIQQAYNIYKNSGNIDIYNRYSINGAEREDARSTINGIVPGIGIELYFLKILEIRYSHEFVNLSGVKSSKSTTRIGGLVGISYEDSKFRYRGTVQNFDLGIRIPKINWLLLRLGITEEKLYRDLNAQYNGFIILNGSSISRLSSPAVQLAYSPIYSANTGSEVKFRNIYFQFELNQAF